MTIGIVFLAICIIGQFTYEAPTAYRDMFISVTIPYVFGAVIYYIVFFRQVKEANRILEKMNSDLKVER